MFGINLPLRMRKLMSDLIYKFAEIQKEVKDLLS